MEADEKLRVLEAALRKRERELFELRAEVEHERGIRVGWTVGAEQAVDLIRLGHSLAQPPPSDGDKGRALLVELLPLFAGLAKEWLAAKAKTREEEPDDPDDTEDEPGDAGEDGPFPGSTAGQAPGILSPWQTTADDPDVWLRASTQGWHVRVTTAGGAYACGYPAERRGPGWWPSIVDLALDFVRRGRQTSPIHAPFPSHEAIEELKRRVDEALSGVGFLLLSEGEPEVKAASPQEDDPLNAVLKPWDEDKVWRHSRDNAWVAFVNHKLALPSVTFYGVAPEGFGTLPMCRAVNEATSEVHAYCAVAAEPAGSATFRIEVARIVDAKLRELLFSPVPDPTDAPDPTSACAS